MTPSRYESQKRRDWNTLLQYMRNHTPPLTLAGCSGAYVIIMFLKYLDQFGKTKVHVSACPYFGHPNPNSNPPCACPLKQAWGSLDALIGRLRAAYEENGGRPESNPFGARAVTIYLSEVREGQAKARGIPYPYEKKKKKRKQPCPHKLEVIAASEHPEQLGHSCNTANNPMEAIELESSGRGIAKDKTEEATISWSSKRPKKGDITEYSGGAKIETMQKEIGVGNQTVDSIKRRGRPPNLHGRCWPTSVAGMKIKAQGDLEQQNVGKECVMKEAKASAVLGMKSKKTNNSQGKTTRPLPSEVITTAKNFGPRDSASGAGGGPAPDSGEGPPSSSALPPQTAAAEGPPSRYESQKRRDWNTFSQYLKNHKPPQTLARCSGAHVIEFLKYLEQFGNTKVPCFGHPNQLASCACPLKQAWGSLDALIGRLRAAYEENGGRPESNPFGNRAVSIYLREVREGQAKARGIPYPCEKKKRNRLFPAPAPCACPQKLEVIASAEHPEQLGHSCNTANKPTEAIQLESLGSGIAKDKTEGRTISPTHSGKNQTEQTTPCNQILSCTGISTKKKLKQATPSSDATASRPSKNPNKGDITEYNGGEKIETTQKEIGVGNQTVNSIKRKGRPPNLHDMEINAWGDHEQQNVGKECVIKEAKTSAFLGRNSEKTNESQDKTACPLLSEEVIPAAEHPEQLGHSCNTVNNHMEAIQLESSGSDTANDKAEERTISPTNSGKNQTEQTTPCNQIVSCDGILTNKILKQATSGSDPITSRPSKRPKKGDTTEYDGGEKIETTQKEIGVENQTKDSIKRKGRPPNLHIQSSPTSVAGMQITARENHEQQNVGKECVMKEAKASAVLDIKSKKKKESACKNACPLLSEETSKGKECRTTSKTKSRGRPPKLLVENRKSSVTGFQDTSIEKIAGVSETDSGREKGSQDTFIGEIAGVSETDSGRENAKMAITKISYDVAGDHQPLRMCSEGINSSTKFDDSNGTVNQWNEAKENKVELAVIDCMDNSVSRSNQKLPFVKSSRIWETVYAMEVFKKMLQNPHFRPLYNFKEEFREGLAIGTTVTFANLVEKMCKMQLDDPRSIWVSYLEVLLDLETHGFDVQVLRNRLNELLAIKDRQEQNLDELNQREMRLLEKVNKNSKIDEEIENLNEKIREFNEKLTSAMSIKKTQDSEIAMLKQRADDTREGIRSAQLDFERLSAVPLAPFQAKTKSVVPLLTGM